MPFVMEISAEPVPWTDAELVRQTVALAIGHARVRYLRHFSPEAFRGRGYVTQTDDLNEAMLFGTVQELLALWRTQSETTPLRPDGKPNRPLTAYTISPREVMLGPDGPQLV